MSLRTSNLLHTAAGVAMLLALASLVVPLLGVAYLLCLTVGGVVVGKLTGKATASEYLRWLDDTLHRGEKFVVAVALLIMTFVVFVDVVWRTAHSASSSTAVGIVCAVFALCVIGGFSARWPGAGWAKRLLAATLAFSAAMVFGVLVYSAPNGFGWSQRLALIFMLWVGMLGTSMASRSHRHIAIDAVKRALPDHLVRPFQIARDVLSVLLLVALTVLATQYTRGHWNDWIDSEMSAGIFAALPIPYWVATAPIAIAFGLMAARTTADIIVAPVEGELLGSLGTGPDGGTESLAS